MQASRLDTVKSESNDPNSSTIVSPSYLLETLESHTDVVSWINDILDSDYHADSDDVIELTELDRRVSSLVGTLEIASEDTSAEVERLIDDISRGAPRLTYDLHFMRDGALSLQAVLQNVESKSKASIAVETNVALDRLHFLDTVKRNMEAAREVLREAESWGTLESDVTSLLVEKNYEKAAERLSEASKSMAVFENTPEYDNRRTLMVSLQNQLEAALSSALVAAVSSQDVAVCRNYFAIFSNIQRETEFRNYYYGSRRASLVEAWQNASLRDCDRASDTSPSAQNFSSFLPIFYTSFLSILQSERTSIPSIFPDPQLTLSTLITSTLSSLQPTFSQRLAAVSTYHGASALRELIAAYRATEEFALAVEKIFEKVGFSAMLSPAAGTENDAPRAHMRRRSSARMSMSMSRRVSSHRATSQNSNPSGTAPAFPILDWDMELFAPFMDFQADYNSLEKRLLDDALQGALRATPVPSGGADRARILRERAVDVFGAAEEAIARCSSFTHGYGAVGLVNAVDHLISAFAEASRAEIESQKGSGRTSSTVAKATVSDDDLADLDYTADDWVQIQSLLHLLEAVRALSDRTAAFEGKLRANLVQISAAFRTGREDSSTVGAHGGTTRGTMQLLMQSSLNSSSLHALLETVDPEPPIQTLSAPSVPPSPDAHRSSFMSPIPSSGPSPAPTLLVKARSAISALASTCQVALQDTILGPLYAHLASYASLQVWAAPDTSSKGLTGSATPSGGAMSAVSVPTFSLSPSGTMARVAEGLLSLPRLFEVYADDDALAVSLETLPYISKRFLRALAEPVASTVAPSHVPPEMKSRRSSSLALMPGQMASMQMQAQAQSLGELRFSPQAVTAAWLSSLTRTLLAHLTRGVLPRIPKLTTSGAAQLAADLSWLANIVEALNVEWVPLARWRKWVEVDDMEGKTEVVEGLENAEDDGQDAITQEGQQDQQDENEEEAEAEDDEEQIMQTVARLRGWST